MYTRCQHCEAIFRVNMREVTVAGGKLRCGECQKVFNARNNLSTTMPEKFKAVEEVDKTVDANANLTPDEKNTLSSMDDWQHQHQNNPNSSSKETQEISYDSPAPVKQQPHVLVKEQESVDEVKSNTWLKVALGILVLLLLLQVLYNNRSYFSNTPKHQPDKIQMLNHNVFSHPNEPEVLLISASMQNNAELAQPYPLLEIKLTNSQSQTIALRRFKPSEYLENYTSSQLLAAKEPTSLKLKIKDPGNNATRFQFNFY